MRGYAAARRTGASRAVDIFAIDGDRMRALSPEGPGVAMWGYCDKERLLTPVLPTIEDVAAMLEDVARA